MRLTSKNYSGTSKEEVNVAIRVRMGFRSMFHYLFTMFFILFCIAQTIPSIMERYAEYPRYIGIPMALAVILFLWEVGIMITTFVQMYLETRKLYPHIIGMAESFNSRVVIEGNLEKNDDTE